MMSCSPTVTLWAICTGLSIFVPALDRTAQRRAIDRHVGADFHVVFDGHAPELGIFWCRPSCCTYPKPSLLSRSRCE